MDNKIKIIVTALCVGGLASCSSMFGESGYSSYESYRYQAPMNNPDGVRQDMYGDQGSNTQPVSVPNSYHVGANHSPEPHKSRDRNWVNSQNPMGYTIEVADDEQAAAVAGKLQGTPQSDRKAEVKYERGGKTYYKGLYGTYDNYQAAKKALDALPPDVKSSARVKNWSSVQGGINR